MQRLELAATSFERFQNEIQKLKQKNDHRTMLTTPTSRLSSLLRYSVPPFTMVSAMVRSIILFLFMPFPLLYDTFRVDRKRVCAY